MLEEMYEQCRSCNGETLKTDLVDGRCSWCRGAGRCPHGKLASAAICRAFHGELHRSAGGAGSPRSPERRETMDCVTQEDEELDSQLQREADALWFELGERAFFALLFDGRSYALLMSEKEV